MGKKRVFHIIQSLDNGGCENMLLRTLPQLQEFEHIIITIQKPGELAPKFISSGISVKTVYCHGFFDISGILRLQRLIQGESPHCIITYLFHADMIGRLTLRSTTNAPIIPFLRTTYNHPKYLIARILEWLTKPLVKQYLANSEAVKNFYTEHLGVTPEKITVIPNGIDIHYFDSIEPDPKLKESLGVKPDSLVIICVANLHINKGHRYLLEAFETIYSKRPNTHLLLVGDGVEHDNLRNQIYEYGSKNNISFLGRRSDVPQLLKISDCFVLPTLFEGQSNALLEAMAARLPIITTAIPENEELITHQNNGWLVPPKSVADLTQAIETLVQETSLRNKLGAKASSTLKDRFSLQASTNKFRKFLFSV